MRAPANMVKLKPEHVRYVSERMRPDEIEQFLAFYDHATYKPTDFVAWVNSLRGPAFTVLEPNGLPAVCGGFFYYEPGTWRTWMMGTTRGWGSSWRSITKASRWLFDGMLRIGAERLQTTVLPSRTQAMEWYVRGLRLERKSEENGMVLFERVA